MFSRMARLMPLALVGLTVGLTGCFQSPVLSVTPAALNFGTATQTQSLRIANAGMSALTWEVTANAAWLRLVDRENGGTTDTLSGSTTTELDVVEVQVDRSVLPQGVRTGSLTVTSNGGTRTVNVSVDQATPAQLSVSETDVDFGTTDENASVVLTNTGVDALTWSLTVSNTSPWLNATPKSGTIQAGSTQVLNLSADRGTLAAGEYDGTITIQSNGGEVEVNATMTVPPFTVAPQSIAFGILDGVESASLTLTNNGFSPIDLSVSTSTEGGGNWLSAGVASLVLAEDAPSTVTLTADPAGVPPGDFTGTVTIMQDSTGFSATVTVTISITRISVNPESVAFGVIQAEQTETVTLTNLDNSNIPFTVSTPALDTWLSVAPASGTLTNTVDLTVTADPTVVDPGEYNSTVTITYEGGDIEVPVSMARPKPAELKVAPDFIDFGTSRTEELIGIWNDGIGSIDWQVDTTGLPAWLIVTPVDGAGIASGTVSGDDTDPLEVRVDRSLAPLDQVNFEETFTVEASGDFVGSIVVTVRMTVPLLPEIVVEADGIDAENVPFVNFAPTVQNKTFIIRNEGRGTLFWNFDLAQTPGWIAGINPAQGSLETNTQVSVTITVDRSSLDFTGAQTTLSIFSNDPDIEAFPLLVEVQVPRFISIGSRPGSLEFGLEDNTKLIEFANLGDPDTILNYQVRASKEWLGIFPETGSSEGTAGLEKDWQLHTVTVNRALLEDDAASAKLIVEAFTIEDGERVPLDTVEPLEVNVSVEAAPLTIENPQPSLRVPSLVRLPLLMRNVRFQPIELSQTRLEEVAGLFSIFENDQPAETAESNQFIKPIDCVEKATLLLMLDYSNSMQEAASDLDDAAISGAPDPLQALYERTVSQLISELPDFYQVGLAIFNERVPGFTDSRFRPVYGTAGEPVDQQDELFIRDRDALIDRLASLSVGDNGATQLFPALIDAALTMENEDLSPFSIPFDDSEVRTMIAITDGRRTTPPGEITAVIETLRSRRVQFLCVGWGESVSTAPLVQIATETGGHYYATRNAPTGAFDAFGVPVRVPVAEELEDWTSTVPGDECDQSISKDLNSMVLFHYVTLNEESTVNVEATLTFNDPTDQNSVCIDEQGEITGDWTATQLNYESIAGDPRLGQISLRSDGVRPDGTATVIVKLEAAPRNVNRFVFDLSTLGANAVGADDVTLVSRSNCGIIPDWDRTVSGTEFTFASPDGSVLAYGDFGDMLSIEVSGIDLLNPVFRLDFDVLSPTLVGSDPDSKYITYPDSITIGEEPFKGTAFPKAALATIPPFTPDAPRVIDAGTATDTVQIFLTNRGGSHAPTDVELRWEVQLGADSGDFLIPPMEQDQTGELASTFEQDVLVYNLERCFLQPGVYGFPASEEEVIDFNFVFNFGSVNVEYESESFFVTYEVLPPVLAVSSPDVDLDMTGNVLDFGDTTTSLRLNVENEGQSNLFWNIDFSLFPNWLTITNSGDSVCAGERDSIQFGVIRDNVTMVNQSFTFDIESDYGTETITVLASPAP